jgi:hypothetical protein
MRTALRGRTTFVVLDGVADARLLACIGDAVAVAVDDGLRIVCARLSARRMLRQFGGGSLAIFSSTAAATASTHPLARCS